MSLQDCCRCCLEHKDDSSQFALISSYDRTKIYDLIKSVTSIEIDDEDEYIPQQVCNTCLSKLIIADEIKTKFIESDRILRGMLPVKAEAENDAESMNVEYLEFEEAADDDEIVQIKEEYIDDEEVIEEIEIYDGEIPEMEIRTKREPNSPRIIEESGAFGEGNSSFKKKYRKREEKSEEWYQCESCDTIFNNERKLKLHINEKHRKRNDTPVHTCPTCDKLFYDSSTFSNHRCGLRNICYYCDTLFSEKKTMLEHMEEHRYENDFFYCVVENCDHKYSRASTMFYHLSSHFNPIELMCEHCSQVFTDILRFRRHVNRHDHHLQFQCDLCGSIIWNRGNLLRHMKASHMNERHYCDECPRSYTDKSILKQHKVDMHNYDAPYQCSKCDAKFIYPSLLRQHETTNHTNGPKIRRRAFHRKKQVKPPKDFVCEYCQRVFNSLANFNRHVNVVHMKVRRFVCPHEGCGSSFGQKTSMIVHYRQHTGEKPHCCDDCSFRCADPSTLAKHRKCVHKNESNVRKKTTKSPSATKIEIEK